MASFVSWSRTLEKDFSGIGTLAVLYVRLGDDLVAVRPGFGSPRRLKGDSALMRTLSRHAGTSVGPGPDGDPFSEALLRELGAEAAVLVRSGDILVALACLTEPRKPFDEARAEDIAAGCAASLAEFPATVVRKALRPHPFRALAGAIFR